MPDPEPALDGSAQANPQQAQTGTQSGNSGIPQGYVPEARLTGALQKINTLTLTIQTLQEQLTAANTRIGELQAQGASQETEWNAKAGEHATALQGLTQERDALKQQLEDATLQQKKHAMIAELGHFNLLAIADQIPAHADEAKQKEAIEKVAAFADGLVKARESQLTAGTTVVTTQPVEQNVKLPDSAAAWEKHINSLPWGSPERSQAFDDYYEWSRKQK